MAERLLFEMLVIVVAALMGPMIRGSDCGRIASVSPAFRLTTEPGAAHGIHSEP
jgi:hypothetical protein